MTISQAERITGLEIRAITALPRLAGAVGYRDHVGVVEVVLSKKPRETDHDLRKRLAQELVDLNYKRNCEAVRLRQAYKCGHCGASAPLSVHHKRLRKMGGSERDDRVENLIALCKKCDNEEHGPIGSLRRRNKARETSSPASSTT